MNPDCIYVVLLQRKWGTCARHPKGEKELNEYEAYRRSRSVFVFPDPRFFNIFIIAQITPYHVPGINQLLRAHGNAVFLATACTAVHTDRATRSRNRPYTKANQLPTHYRYGEINYLETVWGYIWTTTRYLVYTISKKG